MQTEPRRTKPSWWWFRLGVPVLLSLCLPSAREMHILSLRLLFHVRGETEVRGQSSGCIITVVPSVSFTEAQLQKLRAESANSAENYVLASAGSANGQLASPSLGLWTNSPFASWGVFQLARLVSGYSDSTNLAAGLDAAALQLLRHAQSRNPTNGALWLAEAAVHFVQKDDEAALAALAVAASNNVWWADTEATFTNMTRLFERAGFSRLDANTEANLLCPTTASLVLYGNVRRELCRMMEAAVRHRDDAEFNRVFKTIVELRTANWSEKSCEYPVPFRGFYVPDELATAMAERLGQPMSPESGQTDFVKHRPSNHSVFLRYIERFAEPLPVARFRGQSDGIATLRSARTQLVGVQTISQMNSWGMALLSGTLAVFILAFVPVIILLELPFWWFSRRPAPTGFWPRSWKFWLMSVGALAFAVGGFTDAQMSLGLHAKAGFHLVTESEPMSETTEALIVSLIVCITAFAALLVSRREISSRAKVWLLIASTFAVYCTLTITAGIFREQTIAALTSALF